MNTESGTYVLILRSDSKEQVQVGRRGKIQLNQGFYIYVGSAFGPGGVKARVSRHCRNNKKHHWHIDYIREFMQPLDVWYNQGSIRQEHVWAGILADLPGNSAVAGIGCSDCQCYSHLFYCLNNPDFSEFSKAVDCSVDCWSCESMSA